jgi:hypothetical protein
MYGLKVGYNSFFQLMHAKLINMKPSIHILKPLPVVDFLYFFISMFVCSCLLLINYFQINMQKLHIPMTGAFAMLEQH